MQMIRLADLHPHPGNPRLAPREDIVDQIAAQLNGTLDEAHALIVRPNGRDYQIISGHHRKLAAERAGIAELPCWVREMSDEDAYMALALNNAQGELHPLEVGMHALKSGLSQEAYGKHVGVSQDSVSLRIRAARVADECLTTHVVNDIADRWRHLAEIHAAPRWLWHDLVTAMLDKGWSVEITRKAVKALSDAPEPPPWADADTIADRLLDGTVKAADIAKFQSAVDQAKKTLDDGKLQAQELAAELDTALAKAKPSRLSNVGGIIRVVLDKQAALVRDAEQAALAKQREQEQNSERVRRWRRFVSLDEWKTLDAEMQRAVLSIAAAPGEVKGFNKQENDDIEWAQWSWNPITGCLHDCPYCYARDIAVGLQKRTANAKKKVYETGFEPTIYPLRLMAPQGMKPPKEAETDTRYRNVFTGSMSDIFGRWVPREWIEAVLSQVRAAPQWNFLFLTKFPNRMAEFDIPQNAWLGTSVDLQVRVAAAEKAFAKVKAPVKWLSVEPMLEPLTFKRLDLFDWIVIGGASRSDKTPEFKPPFAWIYDLVHQAREANVKVYFKTNLLGNKDRILELPFDAPLTPDLTTVPGVFRYLGKTSDHNKSPEAA